MANARPESTAGRSARPSSPQVSRQMQKMPRRDSGPELRLRQLLHARGHRYRVNAPVPGLPRRSIDIAFGRPRVAVFVDGCFWHNCPDHGGVPKQNRDWWLAKLELNVARDHETTTHLENLGWAVVRVWEHESPLEVVPRIEALLERSMA